MDRAVPPWSGVFIFSKIIKRVFQTPETYPANEWAFCFRIEAHGLIAPSLANVVLNQRVKIALRDETDKKA